MHAVVKVAFILANAFVCVSGMEAGKCSCLCGSSNNTTFVVNSFVDSRFIQAGYPGRIGQTGKQGPPGINGRRGEVGEKGQDVGQPGSWIAPSVSCEALLESGITSSGIYTVKPERGNIPIQVYCDLESAGGGWTLVASVNENNIDGKCTAGDKWSSEQSSTFSRKSGESSSWENFDIFGNVLSATNADYKSPAYFTMDATDVMLWHVPNGESILEAKDKAFLRYYTDSNFLLNYGSNLRLLYKKYFPMKQVGHPDSQRHGVKGLMSALNNSAYAIRNQVSDFYNYVYDFDGPIQNYIKDGGEDMFDSGNKITYKIGSYVSPQITYNLEYKHAAEGVIVVSATSHPFQALMWIGNNDRAIQTFALHVESGTGADGSGNSNSYEGDLLSGNLVGKFYAFSVADAGDPSICEVYYYLGNTRDWGSVLPNNFSKPTWTIATDGLIHQVQVGGRPKSILFGYMLLSRSNRAGVTTTQIRAALSHVMMTVAAYGKIDEYNCGRLNDSLVAPVQYLTGNDDDVLAGIPPLHRDVVTPGFVQFRSLSPTGEPNAICPGVKTESCRPQSFCIGGINTMKHNPSTCGDFAGWAGTDEDTPTENESSGSAKSLKDLRQSILIFTRNKLIN